MHIKSSLEGAEKSASISSEQPASTIASTTAMQAAYDKRCRTSRSARITAMP